MPELPEVETVRKTLKKLVLHKTIENIQVFWAKMIKNPPEVEQFIDALKGETIVEISRRGKFLLFYTKTYVLVSHLRMEGRYGLFSKDEPYDKHTHVIFHFTDGTDLRYRDVRKFGTMHLYRKGEEFAKPPLAGLGPEPFSDEFTIGYLQAKLKQTHRKIKPALLDQSLLVGLGNIYVDESLFRAGIHPERLASSLTKKEVALLHREIVATLSEAVEKGGSTIRSYVNSQGEIGMFQLQLLVYGRNGEECKKCGRPLVKTTVGGRGTHYCPHCQKLKKRRN
ncbi:DNA-formamidopyrimidine glycosylase [Neobacillus sp. YIM B02564]|jgi:formamidopyrimidine-DNA glycosylase|uniref:Formamidopyrimidine-DNA glycosylase n=1 Tax=Neobacillus paridis TaxID=2803862 RepID=A0ABS1TIL8_9BACI|nr:DNA-formamidopyrimidine glycosylase [Neobacillus paridis]MBL4951157.1 DNA-formamidopyrimidine glycosylase [Neobacillus paridis]